MSRIYKVGVVASYVTIGNGEVANQFALEYLVAAVSPGKAQQHVAKKFISAKIASPHDVAELMGRGIKVEDGTAPDKAPSPVQQEANV